jgi:hypothetical protein
MTDRDRFDRELTERLRASEGRAPGGFAPEIPVRSSRRGLIVSATIAATGVLAAGVFVATILQSPGPVTGDATPSSTPSTAATPSPTATAAPTSTVEPTATPISTASPTGAWTTATVEIAGTDGLGPYLSGVRWFSGIGFLAFGQGRASVVTASGIGPPEFWHSSDGRSWTRSDTPQLDDFAVLDVEGGTLPGGPRLVAVTTDFSRTRLLFSDDGLTWTLADTPATAVMYSVAYGDEGFVAVGTDRHWPGTQHVAGVVWRSQDGRSWQAATPSELDNVVPETVEAIVGRGYVALGRLDAEAPPRTLAWTSTDGVAWQSTVVRPAQNDGGGIGIFSDSDGSLVVVAGLDPDAYAGFSTDGTTWSFEWLPEGYVSATAIDISPQAVVVVASQYVPDGPTDSFIWVRDLQDGTWRAVDWHSQTALGVDYGVTIGVAIAPSHTLILFSGGQVLITDGPLP